MSKDRGSDTVLTYHPYAAPIRLLATLSLFTLSACELFPHPGDTAGVQRAARWYTHARLVADPDRRYTIVRLRADTGLPEGHDVLIARFDFDPVPGVSGDEYSIALGLDFGHARDLRTDRAYTLGASTARIPAWATVTCLCRPLKPDSVRGTYTLVRGGSGMLTGRIDATLYFTTWNDPSFHTTYRLRQRIDAVK